MMKTRLLIASVSFSTLSAFGFGGTTTLTASYSGINAHGGTYSNPTTYGSLGVGGSAGAAGNSTNSSTVDVTWSVDLVNTNDQFTTPSSSFNFSGTWTNISSGAIQIFDAIQHGSVSTDVAGDSGAQLTLSKTGNSPSTTTHGTAGPHSVSTGTLTGSVTWVWDMGSSRWRATYNVATKTQTTSESMSGGAGNFASGSTQQYWAATLQ